MCVALITGSAGLVGADEAEAIDAILSMLTTALETNFNIPLKTAALEGKNDTQEIVCRCSETKADNRAWDDRHLNRAQHDGGTDINKE